MPKKWITRNMEEREWECLNKQLAVAAAAGGPLSLSEPSSLTSAPQTYSTALLTRPIIPLPPPLFPDEMEHFLTNNKWHSPFPPSIFQYKIRSP